MNLACIVEFFSFQQKAKVPRYSLYYLRAMGAPIPTTRFN
jgi:hypothetical protein